jgi:cobyrinic acid a,c-diamide synthase
MTPPSIPPGLIVSAAGSGSGKTLVTLGLARALRDRGLAVQCFKSGPDYIDPAFHRAATGRDSFNLDNWAMGWPLAEGVLGQGAGADLVIAEGSMGLHDGVARPGAWGNGSTADLAARTGWPVVLVLDVSGQAQTAGAVALGLGAVRADVRIAGAILNKTGSPRHERLARQGLEMAGIPCLGAVPRAALVAIPERHLGLVQAEELPALEALIAEAAALMAQHLDLPAIRAAARPGPQGRGLRITPPGQRIALARDAAFSFVYPHLLTGWRAAGAEVLTFSPLADEPPPEADVCWLPGGYPELHGPGLAAAERFRAGLRAFAERAPVHGECGGYMALGEAIVDKAGVAHRMAGLLGLVTSFETRRLHLGYRRARLPAPTPCLPRRMAGHEFHYANIVAQPDDPLAEVTDADGAVVAETGSRRGRVSGTFFHLIAEAA